MSTYILYKAKEAYDYKLRLQQVNGWVEAGEFTDPVEVMKAKDALIELFHCTYKIVEYPNGRGKFPVILWATNQL